MKNISIYKTESEVVKFNLAETYTLKYTPLTSLQSETIGFTPIYDDVLYSTFVEGYTAFKVTQAKRKEIKPDALEREFNVRMAKHTEQSLPLDMDVLLSEVEEDLRRMSDITVASYLVVYDHKNNRFLIDGQRGKSEDCLTLVKQLIQDDAEGNTPNFEVLMTEEFVMQVLLTQYVLKPDSVPEPLIVGEKIKIGAKTPAGKRPTAANITITKEDVTASEFTKHLTERRAVHSLELDNDGIIYATVDHTFMVSGVKYEGSLKYKENLLLDECDNWVAEYSQILPEISKLVNLLEKEVNKEV